MGAFGLVVLEPRTGGALFGIAIVLIPLRRAKIEPTLGLRHVVVLEYEGSYIAALDVGRRVVYYFCQEKSTVSLSKLRWTILVRIDFFLTFKTVVRLAE
jgi:hypothetical protein